MAECPNLRPLPPPVSLHARAADNLAFIRSTMANSAEFTGISGAGMIGMGIVALVGAWLSTCGTLPGAGGIDNPYTMADQWWLTCWSGVAILGCGVGVGGLIYKSRKYNLPLLVGAGRKFLLNFSPAIIAGTILSQVFYAQNLLEYVPALWLLLYGVAVISGGAFSILPIPIMGVCFMVAGLVAFFLPDVVLNTPGTVRPTDLLLAASFGGLHIGFGVLLVRKHGG